MWICLAIFAFMLLGYVFADKLHTSSGVIATAVFALVAFSGLLEKPSEVLTVLGNANVTLIVSMFIVSAGFNRTQTVNKLAGLVSKISGGNFTRMLAGYVLLTFALSQFIPSPLAVFAIVSPLAAVVCKENNISVSKVMFPIVLTDVGTCGSIPVGSGATTFATMNGYLESYGYTDYSMALLDPFKGRWLVSILIVLFSIFIAPRFCPEQPSVTVAEAESKAGKKGPAPLDTVREFLGVAIFVLTTVCLIFQTKLGLASWQIALAGAAILCITGVLKPNEAAAAVPIRIVMLIVAALSLGKAMIACGLGDLIGDAMANALGGTTNGYVIGAVFFVVPFILTQFMQNQSVQNIFLPILILTCKSLGCNPIGPLILLNASTLTAFLTPMATPVIPVCMDAGGYNQRDLLKMGWLPSLVIAVVSVIVVMTIFPAY